MDEPRIQYVRTSDGVSIAYYVVGGGPPLVALPAIPVAHLQLEWNAGMSETVELLARQRTCVHYDARGFGLSDRNVSDFSLPVMARDLEAIADLPELVDLYLLRCQVEGRSAQTVIAYRYTLGRFLRSLSEDGVPLAAAAVHQDHLYRYLGRFKDLSLDTRHRYFREVRCFFNWATASGYLNASPFAHLRNVRLPSKIVRVFTPDDLRHLLSACPATPLGSRDRAVLMTLLDTGLRVSELVRLTLDDVDLDTQRLRVLYAKGNKQRVVAFSDDCGQELLSYFGVRGQEPGPLFCASNQHGSLRQTVALRPNGVKQMLRRLGRTTGLAKVHAHRFRHTFATWAIE